MDEYLYVTLNIKAIILDYQTWTSMYHEIIMRYSLHNKFLFLSDVEKKTAIETAKNTFNSCKIIFE